MVTVADDDDVDVVVAVVVVDAKVTVYAAGLLVWPWCIHSLVR